MPRCIVIDDYIANAVHFDGSDGLSKNSVLSGVSDGANGTLSFWFRIAGTNGSTMTFFDWADSGAGANGILLNRISTNKLQFLLRSAAPATLINWQSTATFTNSSTWRHIIFSWDSSTFRVYIDGSDDTHSVPRSAGTPNLTTNDNYIGSNGGSSRLTGDMADLYFAAEYFDLSDTATREKFRSSAGKPVNLGGDGSVPSGTAAPLFLSNPASTFHTNNGTGGDYAVEAGALSASSSSPSD